MIERAGTLSSVLRVLLVAGGRHQPVGWIGTALLGPIGWVVPFVALALGVAVRGGERTEDPHSTASVEYHRRHDGARPTTVQRRLRLPPMTATTLRGRAGIVVVLAATLLAACGPGLPTSVTEGSTVSVGWSENLTSLNASTVDGATDGNREIAAATHDAFARVVDGDVVTDPSFGRVEVTDAAPDSFTVRYDLADRTWSDGVPIDAADLLLAWAAQSGATAGEFDALPSELRQSVGTPEVDQFGRSIDVFFDAPVRDWHTALDVAVPAHIVGQRALGIEDPMEAKQAVLDAIAGGSGADLADVAEVWNTGFEVASDRALPEALTVASGPYRVTGLAPAGATGDRVRLEVNRYYTGERPATFEQVDVRAGGSLATAFPADLDVVQVRPTPDNFEPIRDLERRDHHVSSTNDGRVWVLALRADRGLFSDQAARRAFLRAVPRADLTSAGGGEWGDAFSLTDSLLFSPGADGYAFAQEEAGLRTAYEAASTDPLVEREQAGVPAGTGVCVLYDTDEAFAFGAFQAMQQGVAEAGWAVSDCGTADLADASGDGQDYQAVLTSVPLPDSPEDIAAVWGGEEDSPLTGVSDGRRGRLLRQLVQTANPYDARTLQVEIEAGLVEEAVALPLALDPVVTLSTRALRTVTPESGGAVTLLRNAVTWEPETE